MSVSFGRHFSRSLDKTKGYVTRTPMYLVMVGSQTVRAWKIRSYDKQGDVYHIMVPSASVGIIAALKRG